MSKLQITTFSDVGAVPLGQPLSEEVMDISAVPNLSSKLPGEGIQVIVRLFAEKPCYVTWGRAPEAKNNGTQGRMLSPGVAEFYSIEAGYYVSVVERD